MVLLVVCDWKYTFTMVDIGVYSCDNGAAIFDSSAISEILGNNLIHVPDDELVNEIKLHYILFDADIFPLKTCLMKPYPGKL